MSKIFDYYLNDSLAIDVWKSKYQLKDKDGNSLEETPDDMHKRLAENFGRIELKYKGKNITDLSNLSDYGKKLEERRSSQSKNEIIDEVYNLFKDYKYIIPQGRVMSALGANEYYRSLSNCLRLPPPKDSYSSIMYSDTMLVSAAKRGCGYGLGISNLRPNTVSVKNAANSSTGAVSFMSRYSNSTREVAQAGRRGACLIDIDIKHPDSLDFINSKVDRTKVTGANISVKLWDDFMDKVNKNEDYLFKFPVDSELTVNDVKEWWDTAEYGKLHKVDDNTYVMKHNAKYYYDEIVKNAWENAEPGVFFWDRMLDYDPSNVYDEYLVDGTNASLKGDTLVVTDNGVYPIAELSGQKLRVKNVRGEFNDAICRLTGVNKKLMEVTFTNGYKVYATPEHDWGVFVGNNPYYSNGTVKKVETKDLKVHERIHFPYNKFEGNLNSDLTYIEGYLIGSSTSIENIINRKSYKLVNHNEDFGDIETKEYGIPSTVWTGSLEYIKGFVDGLVSSDGHIFINSDYHKNRITLTTAKENIANDFRKLLNLFGVRSYIRKSKGTIKGYDKIYDRYDVRISGREVIKFKNIFKLSNVNKQNRLDTIDKSIDDITLNEFLSVKSVKYSEFIEDVYDITVFDDTHTFLGEFGSTGNCTIKGTLVLTPTGYKKVEDIKIGDLIATSIGVEPVKTIEKHENYELIKVNLSDGSSVKVTPNHIFYGKLKDSTSKSLVELKAKELNLGDRIKIQEPIDVLKVDYSKYEFYFNKINTSVDNEFKLSDLVTIGDFVGILDGILNKSGVIDITNNCIEWLVNDLSVAENIRLALLSIGCQANINEADSNYIVYISKTSVLKYIEYSKSLNLSDFKNIGNLSNNDVDDVWYATVLSVETDVERDDVYDLYCEESDTWVANGYLHRGCGEQPMSVYDTCRLICLNCFSFVIDPFKDSARLDEKLLYEIAYNQMRLGDNLVDLEIEYVKRIIDKIKSDNEPEEEKQIELNLWNNVLQTAKNGRRVGCGITALGDMLASLNLKYDSDEALNMIDKFMSIKMKAELDCMIDMSITRGSFKGYDTNKEYVNGVGNNGFFKVIKDDFKEQYDRMVKFGRRNVNWSTIAPVGTTSLVAKLKYFNNTSSGCEPQFALYFFRNKKINPNETGVRVDFVDQNGDSWMTYPVMMGGFKEWLMVHLNYDDPNKLLEYVETLSQDELVSLYEQSPWYGSCANDIDWNKRVKVQSVLQKYTTSAISSTINLPNDVSKETVADIYRNAWEMGLKGVTVYRDGCRTGVLVTADSKETKEVNFTSKDATKRPKSLVGDGKIIKVKGIDYLVLIGMLNEQPYEVFASKYDSTLNLPKHFECEIIKKRGGKYDIKLSDGVIISDYNSEIGDNESMITRLISTGLRHGTHVKFIVEQLNKSEGDIVSFGKAIARVLKTYIKDGEKSSSKCLECGSDSIIFEEGCQKCNNCGSSKCG